MKLLILIITISISNSALANWNPAVSECKGFATDIASALDSVAGTSYAGQSTTGRITKHYSAADRAYYKVATYSFGKDVSYLQVKVLPNYYRDGKCVYLSSRIIRD